MRHWYAPHTRPHKERQVATYLNNSAIEVYLPIETLARLEKPRQSRPFFLGYLFAGADLERVGLWSLRYAPGVRGVVMFEGIPSRVDEGIICALRASVSARKRASCWATIRPTGVGCGSPRYSERGEWDV